ncbi:transcriptional regulator, XRE family [Caldicellulosiruptor owensensis OL]|uniref:Transcriptional regulator, XRE family n=1 Tax=Caldicellulosiruptor owensensis (strain ATCC 700167 / DSM 13100 / OL) TaxID=632518 RepID=E4Q602_CALOW|nr:LexA family transcriptional regulator [Caldicellulosiruptor owensensis]ADQ04376.1 transcriptional regulator, XRE family [Caldicellulosiruptor owensensis OL]
MKMVMNMDFNLKLFGLRIRELREKQGLQQKDVAKKLNISNQALSNYELGKRMPSLEMVKKFADFFNVSTDYLMGLTNSPNPNQDDDVVKKFLENNPDVRPVGKMIPIPIIGTVRAGSDGSLACEEYLGSELVEVDTVKDGEYFFLRVKGDSMYPEIFEGDLVLVRKQPDVESGELAVVIVNGDEGVVKKVIKKENAIILQSVNPKYEPIVITEGQDFMVVGKVKRVVRIY